MPPEGIETELAIGAADMQATDMFVRDHGDIPNALFGGGQFPLSGLTSFRVQWRGVDDRLDLRVDDPAKGQYAGEIVRNSARMEWTATVGKYSFVSDPIGTSSSMFAEMGQIRNGYYYLQESAPDSS
jgi:hypothetical protein